MVEEDTAKLGAVKEFESQKRICIYIGELNAQSSSLHIDIAASTSPVRNSSWKIWFNSKAWDVFLKCFNWLFQGIDGITTLSNATSLHHVIQKGEEKIGN